MLSLLSCLPSETIAAREAKFVLDAIPKADWSLEYTGVLVARVLPLVSRNGLENLAQAGDTRAQALLGHAMYFNSRNDEAERAAGKRWLEIAAGHSDARAQTILAKIAENGEGVPQDFKEAARLYSEAAGQRYPLAEYSLGVMYSWGEGCARDYAEGN